MYLFFLNILNSVSSSFFYLRPYISFSFLLKQTNVMFVGPLVTSPLIAWLVATYSDSFFAVYLGDYNLQDSFILSFILFLVSFLFSSSDLPDDGAPSSPTTRKPFIVQEPAGIKEYWRTYNNHLRLREALTLSESDSSSSEDSSDSSTTLSSIDDYVEPSSSITEATTPKTWAEVAILITVTGAALTVAYFFGPPFFSATKDGLNYVIKNSPLSSLDKGVPVDAESFVWTNNRKPPFFK